MFDLEKFLNTSEDEQRIWLREYAKKDNSKIWRDYYAYSHSYNDTPKKKEENRMALSDLAFRLRDEARGYSWNGWFDATKEVWKIAHDYWTCEQFWMVQAKPIHWIAAALEAMKEKNND